MHCVMQGCAGGRRWRIALYSWLHREDGNIMISLRKERVKNGKAIVTSLSGRLEEEEIQSEAEEEQGDGGGLATVGSTTRI